MAEREMRSDGVLRQVTHTPLWLQAASIIGLAGIPVGVGTAIFSPGPLVGAIFPISLFVIWVTGMIGRERG